MTNNKDQLSKLYRQQARDKAPEQLNQSVLNIAAKKSEQLAEKNTQTHFFGRFMCFEKSHWLGISSACCVLVLSLAIMSPLTQTPYHEPLIDEKKTRAISAPFEHSEARLDMAMDGASSAQRQKHRVAEQQNNAPQAEYTKSQHEARARGLYSTKQSVAKQQHASEVMAASMPAQKYVHKASPLPKELTTKNGSTAFSEYALGDHQSRAAERVMGRTTTDNPSTEAQWLKLITNLVTANDFAQARLRAKDFRLAYPDFEQPQHWQSWLPPSEPQIKTKVKTKVKKQ